MIEQAGYRYGSGNGEVIQPSKIILCFKRPTPSTLAQRPESSILYVAFCDHATGVESIRGEEQSSIREAYLTVFERVDPWLGSPPSSRLWVKWTPSSVASFWCSS